MIRVRPFCAPDAPILRQIFHDAVMIGARNHYSEAQRRVWAGSARISPADWAARLGEHLTVVAEMDGKVAGFMTLGHDGHLDLAYVHPNAMGQGVADALHDRILIEARSIGIRRLTTQASLRAQPFFRRMGWKLMAHRTVQLDGQTLANAEMEKTL